MERRVVKIERVRGCWLSFGKKKKTKKRGGGGCGTRHFGMREITITEIVRDHPPLRPPPLEGERDKFPCVGIDFIPRHKSIKERAEDGIPHF